MKKKILILSGSPRKGGNSDILCDEFARGAEESGNEVEKIRVAAKKISPCSACYYCRDHGGKCVHQDDMPEILQKMIDADVLVLRAIGLSNFNRAQIEEILSLCDVKPTILQTELHPYNQEAELKSFLKENGMTAQAWYPLGHGDKTLLQEPVFTELGEKYGKSAAQIILRWHIQSGNVVIPGSKNPAHIRANFDLFNFALTDDEMAKIAALNKNVRYYTSTPELLKKYAEMVPPVGEQK